MYLETFPWPLPAHLQILKIFGLKIPVSESKATKSSRLGAQIRPKFTHTQMVILLLAFVNRGFVAGSFGTT